jgi:phenylacetate-CoA ligase
MITRNVVGRVVDFLSALARAQELVMHDAWPRERLLSHQRARFMRLVRHAQTSSGFYRNLYQGIEPDETLELANLPTVDKRVLMDQFETVVTDPRLRRSELEQHLSTRVATRHISAVIVS